ncbi:MAG: hypothetical protein JNG84_15230, partial [Archangium sp.]|nr:hypothetical protein [Archangium sp.]
DLVDRANLVHASYHELDVALSRYLGTRSCSNFFTYAKHAAREAGIQASDADSAIKVLATRSSFGALAAARELQTLLRRPGILGKASALVKSKRSLGAVVEALHTLRRSLELGNTSIYERMAPVFCSLLSAPGADGASDRALRENDMNGLLAAGLAHYARARELSLQLDGATRSDTERTTLKSLRRDAIREGNNLVVFYEQLYIAQPFYDEMREELSALDGLLSMQHPGGVHRLSRGWADFYPRMGIDARGMPTDPRQLRAKDFPLVPGRSSGQGTITDYFELNFDNPRLRLPALPITRR